MNIIIIIIAFSSIIIENAKSQFDPPEIPVANQNCGQRNPPDIVSNFVFNPTLKQISLFKTATTLWNDQSIKSKIKKIKSSLKIFQLPITKPKKLMYNIYQNIENLELPSTLKDDLFYVSGAIGKELFDFLSEIRSLLEVSNHHELFDVYVDNIQWTDTGKIDKINTLRAVFTSINNKNVSSQNIDYKFIFFEACKYCALEIIEKIWETFTDRDKQDFIYMIRNPRVYMYYDIYSLNIFDKAIILYWIEAHLEFKNPTGININHRMQMIPHMFQILKTAFLVTNIERLQYFFLQLNMDQVEKDYCIINFLLHQTESVILISDENFVFLMQQLSKEKRDIYLQNNRDFSLEHLIDSWPWRYLYFEALETSLKNSQAITTVDWENILKQIFETIDNEYVAFGNHKQVSLWILEKFWFNYRENFTGGLISTCWSSLSLEKIIKLRAVSIVITHWNVKSIEHSTNHMEIINGFMDLANVFYKFGQYNLLYIVAEKIMTIRGYRHLFLEKIELEDICKYFIVNGDRYNEIDRLIEWKYGASDVLKKNFKRYLKWIPIVKQIRLIINTKSFINQKLHGLFDWLNYKKEIKSALKKCIDDYLKSEPVYSREFYRCIKKVQLCLR